ncbi:acyloxyacyl hydrolase [Candidatus Omnitrophota bacterium]
MKKLIMRILFVFLVFSAVSSAGFALELESVGFLSGYMSGDLKAQDDMEVVPIMATFGFDLKPFAEKFGIQTKGILQMQIEPFISPIIEPSSNVEMGLATMFKYAFPLTETFMPYVKFGSGIYYFTLHTREQSTQFNFASSAVAGFSWFFKKDISLDCEYRFRHVSNASIKSPNSGINTETLLMGVSFYFE